MGLTVEHIIDHANSERGVLDVKLLSDRDVSFLARKAQDVLEAKIVERNDLDAEIDVVCDEMSSLEHEISDLQSDVDDLQEKADRLEDELESCLSAIYRLESITEEAEKEKALRCITENYYTHEELEAAGQMTIFQ